MVKKLTPFINIGPGEFIKDEMEFRNWTQEILSEILGISLKSVNRIIKNKQSITVDVAKCLSEAFGQSPEYWLNLNNNYRLRLSEEKDKEREIRLKSVIYNYMPISEMIKKGWIKDSKDDIKKLQDIVRKFWKMPKKKVNFSFIDQIELPNLRKSESFTQFNKYYTLTWFQMAKQCSPKYKVNNYNQKELKKLAYNLFTFTNKRDGVNQFIYKLNNTGVKIFILSHLPKTYIDGASFCDETNPVIVYTKRYDRVDNFWFTIAHEIAHIILHLQSKNKYFINDLSYLTTKEEEEANKYASKWLKTKEILRYFKKKSFFKYISEKRILDCSEELNIGKSIIVGALQHHGKLSYRNLNKLKRKVSDIIPQKYYIEKRL